MANNNEVKNTELNQGQTEPIQETGLIEVKTPWWKTALKIGGYVLSAAGGLLAGLLIGNHMGGDDDDDADDAPAETPAE